MGENERIERRREKRDIGRKGERDTERERRRRQRQRERR